jgi:hypothetical protein
MQKALCIAPLCVIAIFFASQAAAQSGMLGSRHDFSGQPWAGGAKVCEVCHTPHNATDDGPLWNHEASDANGYANNLTTVFDTTWGIPDGLSLLCLGCHDGTVALENFGSTTTGTLLIQNAYPLVRIGDGTTLADNHPISVDYDDTLADYTVLPGILEYNVAAVMMSIIRMWWQALDY